MLHKPAVESGVDQTAPQKARLGIIMFILYLIIYAGFVIIGVLSPATLGVNAIGGLNLAFVYGMGLIVLAIIMGLIYNHLCTRLEHRQEGKDKV